MDKRSHVIRLGAESRHCAHTGCKDDIVDAHGAKYCAHHSDKTNRIWPDRPLKGSTFLFKCASCPFEGMLPSKKHTKVYCDDCAEERAKQHKSDQGKRARARLAARRAAEQAQSNGAEAGQATTAPAAGDSPS